jgi:hypothetical protein
MANTTIQCIFYQDKKKQYWLAKCEATPGSGTAASGGPTEIVTLPAVIALGSK